MHYFLHRKHLIIRCPATFSVLLYTLAWGLQNPLEPMFAQENTPLHPVTESTASEPALPEPLHFVADLQADCRSNFRIKGPVDWQPGRLVLQPDSSISKQINGNWQVTWQFELDSVWPKETETAEFIFQVTRANEPFPWQLVWSVPKDQPGTLALLNTISEDNQSSQAMVAPCPVQPFTGIWQINYTAGLVQVRQDQKQVLCAYLGNETARIECCQWQTRNHLLTLTTWQHKTQPAIRFTEIQQQQAEQVKELNQEVYRLWQNGESSQAIPIAEKSLQLRRHLYGESHPETALGYVNLSAQYMEQAEYHRAEPIMQQALVIYENCLGKVHPKTAMLLNNLALLYQYQGKYEAAAASYQRAINILEQTLGRENPDTVLIMSNLGFLYKYQGKYAKAEPLLQETLAINERISGKNHPNTAISLKYLAELYATQGKYSDAELLFLRILVIYEETLQATHPKIALALNDLGLLYQHQGKYSAAEPMYQRALQIYRESLAPNHPQIGTTLNNLGLLYKELGKYSDAKAILKQALAIKKEHFGDIHPDVANIFNNLALVSQKHGEHVEAENLYQSALTIYDQTLGRLHPETTVTRNNLADLYKDQGKYTEAETLLQHALTFLEQELGKTHPNTAIVLSNLAELFQLQGKYTAAERMFKRALQNDEQHFGPNHPQTAGSYISLGVLYREQGRYAEAEPLYNRGLAYYEQSLGRQHTKTAIALNNLAELYKEQGRFAEAEPILLHSLAIFEQNFGTEHPDVAVAFNNLALLYQEKGLLTKAEPFFQAALAIREKVFSAQHPDTSLVLNNLAVLYREQGRFTEAEPLYLRVLTSYEQFFGLNHVKSANVQNNLAALYKSQGNFAAAEPLLKSALTIFEQKRGLAHTETAYTLFNLADLYEAQGKFAEAVPIYQRAMQATEAVRLLGNDQGLLRSLKRLAFFPHQKLTILYLKMNNAQSAWDCWENSLGRGLLDELFSKQQRLFTTEEISQQQQLQLRCRSLQRLLDWLEQQPIPDEALQRQWLLELQEQTASLAERQRHTAEQYGAVAGACYSLKQIQAQLLPDQALIGWVDHPNQHYGFVVRSQGAPQWVQLLGNSPDGDWTEPELLLTDRIAADLTRLRGDEAVKERLESLRQQRFEPLLPLLQANNSLPEVKHCLVLPSSGLCGVPIEAFAPSYLQFSYCASGTIFAWLREQRQVDLILNNGLLALGDPIYSHSGSSQHRGLTIEPLATAPAPQNPVGDAVAASEAFVPLPGTRLEVEQLVRLAQRHDLNTTTLLASDASEQKLYELAAAGALKQYRYLHFASHGLANAQFPLQSKLILARDRLPDPIQQLQSGQPVFRGELTAETILQDWDLAADLVVLSACQTGLGQFTESEGYLGLTQPLLLAGARSVMVSLWNVEDTATQLFMNRFYENLWGLRDGLSQPMSKVAALHEAKQWLRTLERSSVEHQLRQRGLQLQMTASETQSDVKAEHPFAAPNFWAAFILVGDWE